MLIFFISTVLSFHEDLEFIARRRFNYVTILYLANRPCCLFLQVANFLIAYSTTIGCNWLMKPAAIAEGITMLTSAGLLLIRSGYYSLVIC
jgi:hypothetical protein